ncbi:cell division protein FtsA [Salisediminibacterium halotolerans]|uniref:Cell division protein FtsA n=1 Tax=Salisediminibacterium halotolerans TaxID=517425 RepID=A0A1H9PWJ3_9BACI|nr:cell division protein FtsA [Salisediminibacterium haloalkalitolerans]SER52195.1 cell division protein FtsA [Salisediminibacterium haloalkalitolerans]
MSKQNTYVTLDIGTTSVRVMIGEMTNGSLNVIGMGEAPSIGIKKGAIVDIDDTVQSIRQAVEKAERMINSKINNVVVGVTGNHLELQPCHGVVAVSSDDSEINDEDINRVIDAAQVISIPQEREIVNIIPQQFIVDGRDEISDPRGMLGVRLEMEGMIVTGAKTMLRNLLRCVEKAGLDIAEIALQPLAAGTAALSKDEKNLGVALVDLGGGSTTVSVFEGGTLRGTSQIQVGGDHIANDISVGFRTSKEEAEKIKLEYGYAFIPEASEQETFSVAKIGSDQPENRNQLELANIIEPRTEEIFEMVAKEIQRLGFNDLPGGFVFTGGTAKMPGILELANDMFNQNIRVAVPDYIGVREPYYMNSLGLIKFTHQHMRIQGEDVFAELTPADEPRNHRQPPKKREKQKPREETYKSRETTAPQANREKGQMKKKVSNMFKTFFE